MHSGQCGALASVLLGSQADVSSLAQMQLQVMLREKSFPPSHQPREVERGGNFLAVCCGWFRGCGGEVPSNSLEKPEAAFRDDEIFE